MTPKEAIKKIQARIDTDFLNDEPFPGELEMAIEFLEKAELFEQIKWERDVALAQLKELGLSLGEKPEDKYRWHDLRKDPNDLPETFVEVWICFTDYKYCGDEKFYEKAYRRDEGWDWQGDYTLLNERYEIIAWEEIEPFES